MSLVGNLEDLSLGDILQIISLSQKSGVLELSSDQGCARIVFRSGLVHAALLKGEPNSLREMLIARAVIDPAGYGASFSRAQELGVAVEQTLESDAGIGSDQIVEWIRGAVEAAILEMFTWPAGDFSFDVRNELDPEDPQLVLEIGMNAQYLAMEGLRLRDERERDAGDDDSGAEEWDPNAITNPGISSLEDPLFGDDSEDVFVLYDGDENDLRAPETATDALVANVIERAEATDELTLDDVAEALPLVTLVPNSDLERVPVLEAEPIVEAVPAEIFAIPTHESAALGNPVIAAAPAVASHETSSKATPAAERTLCNMGRMPVVLIDPDVSVGDWVKSAIEKKFARVHVFQQADQGLSRIRQYLIRGETPLVLVSSETQIDPLSGIHGLSDFVKRLKAQSPRTVVLGLRDDDVAPSAMPSTLNGVLRRPSRRLLVDKKQPEGAAASQVLWRAVLEILTDQGEGAAKAKASGPASMRGLRDATAKLQDASSRGEVLPVVLDFASELFARAAILVVREDQIFAISGRGLPSLEVDPLGPTAPVSLPTPKQGWIREVLDSGKPIVAAPVTDADRTLLDCFGGESPKQVYLGPIESGSSVIALLYGDQSLTGAPIPDTHGLEVVLRHAGLALDRAALERAPWKVDAAGR
ncbi:MAG: DUF4388 domain-containing protein [Myxococcota bacterium]|jgi:hypothetical protein